MRAGGLLGVVVPCPGGCSTAAQVTSGDRVPENGEGSRDPRGLDRRKAGRLSLPEQVAAREERPVAGGSSTVRAGPLRADPVRGFGICLHVTDKREGEEILEAPRMPPGAQDRLSTARASRGLC